MRIAVYGGAGAIGSRIVAEALDRDHQVTVITRTKATNVPRGAKTRVGDAADANDVAKVSAEHEVIVSAIGPSRIGVRVEVFLDGPASAGRERRHPPAGRGRRIGSVVRRTRTAAARYGGLPTGVPARGARAPCRTRAARGRRRFRGLGLRVPGAEDHPRHPYRAVHHRLEHGAQRHHEHGGLRGGHPRRDRATTPSPGAVRRLVLTIEARETGRPLGVCPACRVDAPRAGQACPADGVVAQLAGQTRAPAGRLTAQQTVSLPSVPGKPDPVLTGRARLRVTGVIAAAVEDTDIPVSAPRPIRRCPRGPGEPPRWRTADPRSASARPRSDRRGCARCAGRRGRARAAPTGGWPG